MKFESILRDNAIVGSRAPRVLRAAMTLPDGLLIYAENIFRRFPEEFIALGCPNLEKEFELKNATRRMAETNGSKTVEICLHRIRPDSPTAAVTRFAWDIPLRAVLVSVYRYTGIPVYR